MCPIGIADVRDENKKYEGNGLTKNISRRVFFEDAKEFPNYEGHCHLCDDGDELAKGRGNERWGDEAPQCFDNFSIFFCVYSTERQNRKVKS